jgi:hypothetical protein
MKETLLEIVQDILSDSDSDLVNSIDDTPEAQQVAQIVKRTFKDIVSTREWPHLQTLAQIDGATLAKPTHSKIGFDIKEVKEIRYDVSKAGDARKNYKKLEWLYPEEFLDRVMARDTTRDNVVGVMDDSGVTLAIVNDTPPQYYTSFNDKVIILDSYDSSVDDFIQNSKSSVILERMPTWVHEDDAIPDLPAEAFTLLVAESKSRAFLALSQEPNEKAEQQAYRARVWLSRKAWETHGGVRYPNYGRRGRK